MQKFDYVEVESVEVVYESIEVVSIKCEPHPYYFSNNILSHNCDSLYAVDSNQFTELSINNIIQVISNLIEQKKVIPNTITFSGGEPMIQLNTTYGKQLIHHLDEYYPNLNYEIETNGLLFKRDKDFNTRKNIQLNISPKFWSGDEYDWRTSFDNCLDDLKHYINKYNHIFKFVLENDRTHSRSECIQNISEFISRYNIDKKNVYIMTEGLNSSQQSKEQIKADLEFCLINGYHYTPRLHILVYDQKRGV